MDIRLFEKLREAAETTAIADSQKKMALKFRGQGKKFLKDLYQAFKFWLLTDGTLIPVEYAHGNTSDEADVLFRDLVNAGAVTGDIADQQEMDLDVHHSFTTKQKAVIKKLFKHYLIPKVYVNYESGDVDSWDGLIKSAEQLDHMLTYGKDDVDEGELLEKLRNSDIDLTPTVNPQKVLKDAYKGKSTKLTPSTWPSARESHEQKFWLLQDGTIIPVEYSHAKTILDQDLVDEDGDLFDRSFMSTGAVAGNVNDETGEMSVAGNKKLTSSQISQLKSIAIQYKASSLVVELDIRPYRNAVDFSSPIKSSKHLDYLLKYGPMDESEDSTTDEKEQFFVDRTNTHIELVQGAAAKIVDAYPEFDALLKQVEVHDQSKLEEPERTPYVEITWRHKMEKEEGEYDPYNGKGYQTPGKLEKEEENEATMHHITTNSHHPEYYLAGRSDDANVDMDDRSESELVDASLMPEIDVAEMISDWQAMSEELGTNTAREWFNKQKEVRWHFSEQQEKLMDKLLAVFEDGEPAVTESKHSHDKCMDCSSIPEVEVLWAEGMGHCWFCMKHFKNWATKGDGKGDVCGVKKIQKGKASKDWKSNTSPGIMDTMKFLTE